MMHELTGEYDKLELNFLKIEVASREGFTNFFCHIFTSAFFWSINGVYILQNANNLTFKLFS